MILLEHTAGQGTCARRDVRAARVHHRADARPPAASASVWTPATCFASGYDHRSPEATRRRSSSSAALIGFDRLKAFHLNDSKQPQLGSRRRSPRRTSVEGCLGPRAVSADRQRPPRSRVSPDVAVVETPRRAQGKATGPIAADPAGRTAPEHAAETSIEPPIGHREGNRGRQMGDAGRCNQARFGEWTR